MSKPRQVNQRDQVQKILETLHRHSDLVSTSLVGRITDENSDDDMGRGIAALTGVGALMPMGEGEYQLNPRIRRFLNERLSQFSALQALTRISEQVQSGRAQWRELIDIQTSGDVAAKAEMEDALVYTVGEIVYFMRQNLRLLNHQTATDFGNVESMRRKLRQNRFYGDNVKTLITELDQLDAFLNVVDSESLQYGLYEMRNLLMSQVRSQMGLWRHQLNEIQALISQRLFVRRQIEADLRLLLDAGLWLESNPTLNGFEIELGQSPDVVLLSPTPIKVRPRYDIRAKGTGQEDFLRTVAAKLPAAKASAPVPAKEVRPKQVVLATEPDIAEVEMEPEDLLVQELVEGLRNAHSAFSILQWQHQKRKEFGIGDEEWLLYASSQLAIAGIHTELQYSNGSALLNAVFEDVIVFPESASNVH